MNRYGRYDEFIDVRCKVKNPRTGRMVFMDGRIGRNVLKSRLQTNKEMTYFGRMKKFFEEQVPRHSKRLVAKQRFDDGMNTTLKLDIHLRKTVRMLTIKI
jgi:hypothetical protein